MLRRVQLDWMLGIIYQLVELYLKDDKEKDSPLVPTYSIHVLMYYPAFFFQVARCSEGFYRCL